MEFTEGVRFDSLHLSPEIMRAIEKRNIGIVFQDYAVWPHMTVIENVSEHHSFALSIFLGLTGAVL